MSAEKWADWCEESGGVTFAGTRMVEHSRKSWGERWCFKCRTRHEFWFVVMVPDGLSYYGPHGEAHGVMDGCTDLFPGWSRAWGED